MSIKYTFKVTSTGVKLTVTARDTGRKYGRVYQWDYEGATRAECVKQAVEKADIHASIVLS